MAALGQRWHWQPSEVYRLPLHVRLRMLHKLQLENEELDKAKAPKTRR